jgi:hypothetical protein
MSETNPTNCPRCGDPMAEAWVVKGCGRWRIYADGKQPKLHHPEPPYTLSAVHCPACWFEHIHRKEKP